MWNNIKVFLAANWRAVAKIAVPAILVLIILSFSTCSSDSAQSSGSGGLAALLVAAGVFFVASRMSVSPRAVNWLVGTGIFMIILWVVPRFLMGYKAITGFEFSLVALIVLGLILWIRTNGSGKLGWRTIVVVILLASMIGPGSKVVVNGLKEFWQNTGIKVPGSVSRVVDSVGKDLNNIADRKAAQTEQGTIIAQRSIEESGFLWVGKDAKLYRDAGSSSPSELEERTEPLKVKVLNKTIEEKGVKLQRVRFPDAEGGYVNGPEFWVEATALLTESETFGGAKMPAVDFDGGQIKTWLNWLVSVLREYWLIVLAIIAVLFLLRNKGISKLSPIKIFNLVAVVAVILIFVLGVVAFLGNTGGVDLFKATEKAVSEALGDKPVAKELPEVQIDLANLYDLSKPHLMLTLNCRYQKVILTSDLAIQATGGRATALFGGRDTGVAKVKLQDFGYQKVSGRLERTNSFLSLARGTIIDFRDGDRTIHFAASGNHKVSLVPKTQGSPIIFSYKEFKGPL